MHQNFIWKSLKNIQKITNGTSHISALEALEEITVIKEKKKLTHRKSFIHPKLRRNWTTSGNQWKFI